MDTSFTALKEFPIQEELIPEKRLFSFRQISEMKLTTPEWVIRGILEEDCLCGVFGQTGSLKTFVVMDMGLSIACGIPFHGRKTQKGVVIYVAGEGQSGIMRRATAWAIKNNVNLSESLFFVSVRPAALLDSENITAFDEEIVRTSQGYGKPVLIIFDTLNRNMGGGDENSTGDMTSVIAACDRIRALYHSTIILVHHTGHQTGDRARGSSVYRASLDTEYRIARTEPDGQTIKIDATKMKDGPPPEPMFFDLIQVELGIYDDDGYELTSAVLIETEQSEQLPKKISGKWQTTALNVIKALYQERQNNLSLSGLDPDGAYVSEEDFKAACYAAGIPRNRFYEAKKALITNNVIEIASGIVRCLDNPSSDVRFPVSSPPPFIGGAGQDGHIGRTQNDQTGQESDKKPDTNRTDEKGGQDHEIPFF